MEITCRGSIVVGDPINSSIIATLLLGVSGSRDLDWNSNQDSPGSELTILWELCMASNEYSLKQLTSTVKFFERGKYLSVVKLCISI